MQTSKFKKEDISEQSINCSLYTMLGEGRTQHIGHPRVAGAWNPNKENFGETDFRNVEALKARKEQAKFYNRF